MSLPYSYLQPEEPNVYAKRITHTLLTYRWRAVAGGGVGAMVGRGMRHTSIALYFYGASKKSLHKPRATSENVLFHISYGFNY